MRAHGIARFPDPSADGSIPKIGLEQLGVSSARFAAAQHACRQFLPNGGAEPNAAQLAAGRALGLRFAQCMRRHGMPSFPDPGSDGRIPDPASVGLNQGSPRFESANSACAEYRPPYMPSNAAYTTWARQNH